MKCSPLKTPLVTSLIVNSCFVSQSNKNQGIAKLWTYSSDALSMHEKILTTGLIVCLPYGYFSNGSFAFVCHINSLMTPGETQYTCTCMTF